MNGIRTVGVSLAICLAASAQAQGWQGWQVGGSLGLGEVRGSLRSGTVFVNPGYSLADGTFFGAETVDQLAAIGSTAQTRHPLTAGVSLAWNAGSGGVVHGWMFDATSLRLRLRHAVSQNYRAACCTAWGFTLGQSMDASQLLALRWRAGAVRGDWLWYGSAGLAWTALRVGSSFVETSEDASVALEHRRWRAGLALGVGAERRLPGGWSWRLEWLWVDFGTARDQANGLASPGGTYPNAPWMTEARLKARRLSVGLQRHW